MPGSTNFLQWNPNAINQETDTAYNGDSMRSGGAPANAIFASPLANKGFYQWSIFVAAFAQMLATKGYSPNDGSATPASALANLEAVLANVMTQADMSPWALLASPAFTGSPTAPTPPTTDNSTRIATTAFVEALLQNLIFPVPQKIILPNVGLTANVKTSVATLSVTFPTNAPHFRIDVRYAAFATIGPNALAVWVEDTTNNIVYAPSGQDANGSGFVCCSGSELGTNLYAPGAAVNFVLKAMCNANANITTSSGLFGLVPTPQSFISVTPIPSV